MKWFVREASLVTALAALVLVLQPSWLTVVGRPWLVVIALAASGAILSGAFGHIPTETPPTDNDKPRGLGDVRQMRDIEQANEFLLAVDFQLSPFLNGAIRDIAAQRLMAHWNVVLEREPDRARRLLGEEVWQAIGPSGAAEGKPRWNTISLGQLSVIVDALEKV